MLYPTVSIMQNGKSGGSTGEDGTLPRVAKAGLFASGTAGLFGVLYWYAGRTSHTFTLWDIDSSGTGIFRGVESGEPLSPLAFATLGTVLIAGMTLVLWKAPSPADEGDEGARTTAYADSTLEKIAHSLDGVVREQYPEPATVHIQWVGSSDRRENHTETVVNGIILEIDDRLRLDIADGSDNEQTFQDVNLDDAWIVWINDRDGKRSLHLASDEAHDEWRREHPDAAYESPFDTGEGQRQ